VRTGIHAGNSLVGNIGSLDRVNFTALGDTVNLASRLEGVNKIFGTATVLSQAVMDDVVSTQCQVRLLGVVAVKGKAFGARVFDLLGLMTLGDEDNNEDQVSKRSSTSSRDGVEEIKAHNVVPNTQIMLLEIKPALSPQQSPPTSLYSPRSRARSGSRSSSSRIFRTVGQHGQDTSEAAMERMRLASDYDSVQKYTQAVEHYLERKFVDAREMFQEFGKMYPNDKACQQMINECGIAIHDPPPANWDGTVRMVSK